MSSDSPQDQLQLVNGSEAAQILGVCRQRVSQLVKEGALIPEIHLSRAILFDIRDVRAFAERRSQRAGAPA